MIIRYYLFFILVLIPGITSRNVTGQCIPDTSCHDFGGEPGQICPDSLPLGIVGEAYETIITILPPEKYTYITSPIPVIKIHIDTITNLPPGIQYELSTQEMYPDTLYCSLLQGIPTFPGLFPLKISVTATLDLAGLQFTYSKVDSTSVVFTVQQSSDNPAVFTQDRSSIMKCTPNPFSGSCRIGIFSTTPSEAYLRIFNMLGKLVYSEKKYTTSGDTYFAFNGVDLIPGMYIYSVNSQGNAFTRRLIKLK